MAKKLAKVKTHLDCSPKEDALARAYVLTTNTLQQNYVVAGYADHGQNNRQLASQALQRPHVAERVDYYRSMMNAKLDIRAERITAEFASIAFVDPIDVFDIKDGIVTVKDLDQIPPWARRAIMSVKSKRTVNISEGGDEYETTEIEVKFHPKVAALTKLAEIKNMFKESNKAKAPQVHLDLTFEGAR